MTSCATVLESPQSPKSRPCLTSVPSSPLERLRRHPLFAGFDEADFQALTLRIRSHSLAHHDLLYHQDMPARHFYFLVSGNLRLFRLDASGTERTLDSHVAGDCFGEVMIYAEPAQYACYAEALKASEVLAIPLQAYRSLVKSNPAYAMDLLRHYAGRAVSRFHDLEIMTVKSARERVVRYLLDLPIQSVKAGVEQVELPLPKCLIASRLAMQPETLSRALHDLKDAKLLEVRGNRIQILDRRGLEAYC